MEASERGVSLRIGPETLVRGHVVDPQDVTTVLGNLIDNAVSAAVGGSAAERWVEVELLDDASHGGTLHIVVADSGDGLAGAGPEEVFAEGFTTAAQPSGAAAGQGFGLALVRNLHASPGRGCQGSGERHARRTRGGLHGHRSRRHGRHRCAGRRYGCTGNRDGANGEEGQHWLRT